MKRFEQEAILARMLERLRMSEDWAKISGNGTIGNIFSTIAEGRAEDARYLEFLYGEKKWKTAMNFSSLTAQGDLLSYKRNLPQSAIGYIIVSHTDENGVDRLANYGKYFFDINAASDYDNLEKNETASVEEKKALVPWTSDDVYQIPKGTRFLSSSGIEFISTATVTSNTLKTGWNSIASDPVALQNFYEAGGWNGIKYLKVPVIQGIQKSTSIGMTDGSRYQTMVIKTVDIENAANKISAEYFNMTIRKGDIKETWVEIDNIKRAGPYDKVFEKKILADESGVKFIFGNGITGAIPVTGAIVTLNYLETLGAAGNVDMKYDITEMIFPNGFKLEDPRTNTTDSFLSCINISPIQGGKDIEDISLYRDNAPISYQKSYTTATVPNYLTKIKKYSPLNLMKIKVFPDESFICEQVDSTIGDYTEEVLNEVSTIRSDFKITALLANGEVVPESEAKETLVDPLILSMGESKSVADSISYVEPNLIKVAPSITVRSSDLNTIEEDIKDYVTVAVTNDFDIYNQDFNEPLNKSSIVSLAKQFSFSDAVNVSFDAIAKTDYDNIELLQIGTTGQHLLAIPFSFDKLFAQDKYNAGFKNCELNSDYLLKVDMKFKNDSSKEKLNRTFFLYDNRIDESGDTTLQDAKTLQLDANIKIPSPKDLDITATSIGLTGGLQFYNEYEEGFYNRQVRVAQFPYLKEITDAEYMIRCKSFGSTPKENRPYETTDSGANKVFQSSQVSSDLRVSLSNTAGTDTGSCYKKNTDYIDYVDIIFNENYEDPESEDYATGWFIIPLSYMGFAALDGKTYDSSNPTNYLEILKVCLNQYLDLKVMATPRSDDFYPAGYNDIIYIDAEDIKVKKEQI